MSSSFEADRIRRSVALLSCATFCSMAAQRLCDAMLPDLARSFEVGLTEAAGVISWFAVMYGVFQLVYGPLGDRWGKRRVVMGATLVCSLGNALALGATSLDQLIAARMVVGAGAAALIPLSMAWIGDAVPYARRQETLARLSLGTTLGLTAGQLVGGVLTDALGWKWAFGVLALVFAGVAGLLWRDLRQSSDAPLQIAPVTGQQSPAATLLPIAAVRTLLREPLARLVLGVAVLEGIFGFGVLALWATHLHRTAGLSVGASGAIVALFGLGGMAYMALARRLIPRLREYGLAGCGMGLLAVAALVIAFSPWWWTAPMASAVGGFGFFMFHNTLQTQATQMSATARGTAMTMFAATLFAGQSVGVTGAAHWAEVWGSTVVIAVGHGVMVLVGLGFALRLRHRPRESC